MVRGKSQDVPIRAIFVLIILGIAQLDLSSREDHAKAEINPFTIAAKNKRAHSKQTSAKIGLMTNAQGNDGDKASRITVAAKDRGNYLRFGGITLTQAEF